MLSTQITYQEYERIILTLNPKEKETLIEESWDVFEHASDDRIDYWGLIERINLAVSQDAKQLKNAWNFKTMVEIYSHIA